MLQGAELCDPDESQNTNTNKKLGQISMLFDNNYRYSKSESIIFYFYIQ